MWFLHTTAQQWADMQRHQNFGSLSQTFRCFFSIHEGEQLIKTAKAVGVKGFLHKRDASETLLDAVYQLVHQKGTFFPDSTKEEDVVTYR